MYHTSPLSNPWWARVRESRRVTFQTERGVRIKVDRDYRAADTKASFRTQEKNLSTIVSKSNMNTLYTNNLLEQNIRHQQTKCFSQLTNCLIYIFRGLRPVSKRRTLSLACVAGRIRKVRREGNLGSRPFAHRTSLAPKSPFASLSNAGHEG